MKRLRRIKWTEEIPNQNVSKERDVREDPQK